VFVNHSKKIKNTTLIFLLTLLTVTLIVFQIDVVYADKSEKEDKKITIKQYIDKSKPSDLLRMHEITLLLEDDMLTKKDKKSLEKEAKQIRKIAIEKLTSNMTKHQKDKFEVDKNKVEQHYNKLIKALNDNPKFEKLFSNELVGFGIDHKTNKLFIDIDESFSNQKNANKYHKIIKKILGKTIDFEFRSIERPQMKVCVGIQNICDPIEGALKIKAQSGSDCSMGFKALDGTTPGFIMAGHCGEIGDKVYQPIGLANTVGIITKDGLTNSDTYTYCDCAFVDTTGYKSVNSTIYTQIKPTEVGTPIFNDYVTMKGFTSGAVTGQIINANYCTKIGEVWLISHFRVNSLASHGDSGGPVYETGNSNGKLIGFISGGNIAQNFTIISPANKVGIEMPGVTIDFS